MKLTLKHILDMKEHTNNLGINVYQFFFMNLENNFLSKMNGTKRNLDILKDYDKETQEFIILQLAHVREEATVELMNELGIIGISIPKENRKHVDLNLL